MSSNSIAIQQKRKKRVTFGDTDVVFGNDDAHNVQETPSSPSSHRKRSPPHTSTTTSVRATKMEDEQASVMSSSLPAKSSLTRLLEQSSSSTSSNGSNSSSNGTGNNPAAAINSQRNYRDIKQRYFQSLGVRQRQQQQQQQLLIQQQRLPPTRRRSASEATPSDFLTSPQRQQRESRYGIPIPNRDGPSPLAMALERETQLRSASVDSGPSPAQAIPINGASAHVGVQRRSASQDMASTLGVSLSVRKHVRYLGEYGEGLKEEEEFLPPHLIAERERSEFSVYQHKKTRGALRNMQLFEAM